MDKKLRNKKIQSSILSMIMPGLGQIYNHQISKGVSLFLGFSFSILGFSWLGIHGPEKALSVFVVLGFLFALAIYFVCVIDAFKKATLQSGNGELQKPHVYIAIIFFGYFFILQQVADYTENRIVKFYSIPSESMSPNVLKGDFVFVSKEVNCMGCARKIRRGDIATFVYPNDRTTAYIKRIIGLPGDSIEIRGEEVFINGNSIVKPETVDFANSKLKAFLNNYNVVFETAESGDTYPVIWKKNEIVKNESFKIPAGHVFVLGDNRSGAMDSRHFGYLPLTDIIGLAKQVLFSSDDISRTLKVVDVN